MIFVFFASETGVVFNLDSIWNTGPVVGLRLMVCSSFAGQVFTNWLCENSPAASFISCSEQVDISFLCEGLEFFLSYLKVQSVFTLGNSHMCLSHHRVPKTADWNGWNSPRHFFNNLVYMSWCQALQGLLLLILFAWYGHSCFQD